MNSESQPQEEKKTGRPSDYTDGLADAICDRLADGESLRKICADDEMPNKSTVLRWLDKNPAFCDQYERARARQTEGMVDDILEIADDSADDFQEVEVAPGVKVNQVNHEVIQRSRIRVDARLKLMQLLNPKKYGKKLALEVKDERTARQLSDADLAEIAAADE